MHAYSSFGLTYVQCRYARAEELRELRRQRMFFIEVNDLFRIALLCSVQRKSCLKVVPRGVVCERESVVVHLSKLWAVVQGPVVMVGNTCDGLFDVHKWVPILQPSAC